MDETEKKERDLRLREVKFEFKRCWFQRISEHLMKKSFEINDDTEEESLIGKKLALMELGICFYREAKEEVDFAGRRLYQ